MPMSSKTSGFGLPDVLIAVGVMLIVVVMAFPSVSSYLQRKNQEEDAANFTERVKALQAYSEDYLEYLPNGDPNNPANLDRYTNLSPQQISQDAYGRFVYYRVGERSVQFREKALTVGYGILYGLGEDGCFQNTGNCSPADDADIQNAINALFDEDLDLAGEFANYEAVAVPNGTDDVLVKFNNFEMLREKYYITAERLAKMSEGLAEFAQRKYYEDLAQGGTDTETKIYVPVSTRPAGEGNPDITLYADDDAADSFVDVRDFDDDGNNEYNHLGNILASGGGVDRVCDDFAGGAWNTSLGATTAQNTSRYNSLRCLAKGLGLPEEYCCDATEPFDHDNDATTLPLEMPFYYYSNPRRIVGGACEGRPNNIDDNKNPPRLIVDPTAFPCG